MTRLRAWLVGAAIGPMATGCVAIDPDATLCAVGGADCACTLGGACDPGLSCQDGRCVDPNGTGTTGVSTDSSGPGPESSSGPTEPPTTEPTESESESSDTDTPATANVAFVTSTRFTAGALGGLAGADAICQEHAQEAGLAGTYVAWLSLPGDDARDRLGDATGWVRPDGRPLALDKQQIIDGRFFYPPVLDEHGTFAAPDAIWTGTFDDGTAFSLDEFGLCGGWTVDEPTGFALIGDVGAGPGWWTAWASQPCTGQARLACLGVDQQFDLVVEPTVGRLAFVSNGFVPPTGGRDVADALCQTEAADAGHDGTFLSLLAVNGEAPADRFDPAGAPWVRADGIPVFEDGDAFGSLLATPLVFDAMGNPSILAIGWAGSYGAHDPGMDSSNCTNWSLNTGFAGMFNLIHIGWQGWMIGGGDQECAQGGYSVICLEQ